jgi:hypothetical protein
VRTTRVPVFVFLLGLSFLQRSSLGCFGGSCFAQNTDLGEELMMLPTDMALIEDEKFLPYVKKCTFLFPSLIAGPGEWRARCAQTCPNPSR